ncbi:patatin-like phospholipase family protein [Flavivirga abyssicola]|uniref:patatin-like phospholipase family protein n=1 Tax=Flavivirga abyssicola TaxID=3063533 RepID=UPI0026DEE532|nr:patatin-like phospholipase family protein [Flavivirga sp. MEBiC07777]WVK12671.1 patatin-like phospholipase family protein [Flavivirga sp. MEBiC07777]
MPGKTLRICLAMGGGVSLGSFSGSALTEALKLLILYGQDADGNEYDNVIVDGMSGASAGAIALTIMLKTLIDYKSMLFLLPDLAVNEDRDDLLESVAKAYFDSVEDAKKHPKIEALKALETAQMLQEKLWVEELDAGKLFGYRKTKNHKHDVHQTFGLLDRQLLEKLAKKYIIKPKFNNLGNIQVLDTTRVPFACSLTNLLPIEIKKNEKGLPQLEKNVIQSVGAQNHTEVRIIDFVFDKSKLNGKITDDRWLEFADVDDEKERKFDINSSKAWAVMCSSALACGAFPIAFEPVILKRYKEEFDGKDNGEVGQWPIQFNDLNDLFNNDAIAKKSSVFNESKNNVIDYKSFNFPYVDGGTFNNEPIREAYRIGAFQDFGHPDKDTDRLVLFVDPIVRTEKYQTFIQSSLTPIGMKKGTAEANSEFSKLIDVTSSLINSLKNQGRVKEEHKISDVKENLVLRNTVFDYLESNTNLGKNLTVKILETAYDKISTNLKDDIIPLGTRKVITYFQNELKKACVSKKKPNSKCLLIGKDEFDALMVAINAGDIKNDEFDPKGYNKLGISSASDKNIFARTVFKTIFDFSLNTDGKNEKAERVAILPINSEKEIISLPGEEVSAFGGFASLKARRYAFHYGRLSTLHTLLLAEEGFRQANNSGEIYPFVKTDKADYIETLLTDRITGIKFHEGLHYQNNIRKELVKVGLKRVVVVTKHLLGRGKLLLALGVSLLGVVFRLPSRLNWFMKMLSGFIYRRFLKKKVEVTYANMLPVTISILSNTKLSRKAIITTTAEDTHSITMYMHNIEDVHGNKRYQYLFQVYRALYRKDTIDDEVPKKLENKVFMGATYSLEPEKVDKIKLTLQQKVPLPSIDGNLFQDDMVSALHDNFKDIIYRIRIRPHYLPSINEALEAEGDMLRHSFLNIEYHLNPMLEIDVDDIDKGWYFKENTQAMHKSF